jgi:hypothetical protein
MEKEKKNDPDRTNSNFSEKILTRIPNIITVNKNAVPGTFLNFSK